MVSANLQGNAVSRQIRGMPASRCSSATLMPSAVCVDHDAVLLPDRADCGQTISVRAASGDEAELGKAREVRRLREIKGTAGIDLAPEFLHRGGIAADKVEDKALEI